MLELWRSYQIAGVHTGKVPLIDFDLSIKITVIFDGEFRLSDEIWY